MESDDGFSTVTAISERQESAQKRPFTLKSDAQEGGIQLTYGLFLLLAHKHTYFRQPHQKSCFEAGLP